MEARRAGILDFVLAFAVFAVLTAQVASNSTCPKPDHAH